MEAHSSSTPSPPGLPSPPLPAPPSASALVSSEQCVSPPPIVSSIRQSTLPPNPAITNPLTFPSFDENMRSMIDLMQSDCKRLRTESKSAIKTHREASARYNKALGGRRDSAAELKRREKNLEQRRRRVSRYETELNAFEDQLIQAAESGRVTSPFFETANRKYEDLLREKEALHRKEVGFAEFMKLQSDSEFAIGKLRVDEMRSRLASRRASIRCREREDESSGVENMTKTWLDVKEGLDDDYHPGDDARHGADTYYEGANQHDKPLRARDSSPIASAAGIKVVEKNPAARQEFRGGSWFNQLWLVE